MEWKQSRDAWHLGSVQCYCCHVTFIGSTHPPAVFCYFLWHCVAFSMSSSVLWHCWLGVTKNSRLWKLSDNVLTWLSVWSEVQMVCIWSSWCHCHIISCFIKIQTGLTFLVPAYPGPGKEVVKQVSVCLVCCCAFRVMCLCETITCSLTHRFIFVYLGSRFLVARVFSNKERGCAAEKPRHCILFEHTRPSQPFYIRFTVLHLSGTTQVSRCQKRTCGLYGARKINRGRHTDHPAGRHSIRTNQCPPPPSCCFNIVIN